MRISGRWFIHSLIVGAIGAIAPLIALSADDATVFDSLYGRKIQKAAETSTTADDIALAAELLKIAGETRDHPGLARRMCESAAVLGSKDPAGYDTAIAALRLQNELNPAGSAEALDRIATLQQRRYNTARPADRPPLAEALIDTLLSQSVIKAEAGNFADAMSLHRRAQNLAGEINSPRLAEIKQGVIQLGRQMKLQTAAQNLKDKIKAAPADRDLPRQLALAYVVDWNSPIKAAEWAAKSGDAVLAARIAQATKKAGDRGEKDHLELADWYRELSESADSSSRLSMLSLSRENYLAYLDRHADADLLRKKAELALLDLERAIEKLTGQKPQPPAAAKTAAAPPKQPEWIDLLKLVNPVQNSKSGVWQKSASGLEGEADNKSAGLAIPMTAAGSYEFQATFMRQSGDGDVAFLLPVGRSGVGLHLNARKGTTHFLTYINPPGQNNRDLIVDGEPFENGRAYQIAVKTTLTGDQARITIQLDGKRIIEWSGSSNQVSIRKDWAMGEGQTLGLGVYRHCKAVFSEIKILKISEPPIQETKPAPTKVASASPASGPEQPWVDLLQKFDLAPAILKGPWVLKNSQLSLTKRNLHAQVELLREVAGDYQFTTKMRRNSGNESCWVTLPVADHLVAVVFGTEKGAVSGLDRIYNQGPKENKTEVNLLTETNRVYHLTAIVRIVGPNARITCTLDGQPYIDWSGPHSELSLGPIRKGEMRTNRCIVLGSYSPITFWDAKLRKIAPLSPGDPGAPQAPAERPVVAQKPEKPEKPKSMPEPEKSDKPAGNKLFDALRVPKSMRQKYPDAQVGAGWTDLLSGAKPEASAAKDRWSRRDSTLAVTAGPGAPLDLPQGPGAGAYEMVVRVERKSGGGGVGVKVPVGSRCVMITLTSDGGGGLSMLDGQEFDRNETATEDIQLPPGKPVDLYIRVEPGEKESGVLVAADTEVVVAWLGENERLAREDPGSRLALSAWQAEAEFQILKFRPVTPSK